MKKVIITGATGMVGGLVLRECLNSDEVESVVAIMRRPLEQSHHKLTVVLHDDFSDFTGLENYFKNQDIAYYCLGVYLGEVSRDEFCKITIDYTAEFAKVIKTQSPEATFCFLSGQRADPSGNNSMFFARIKGAAEKILLDMKFEQLYIFRPGYIYPVTKRKEPNLAYRISRRLYGIIRLLMPDGVVTSEYLANIIFKVGMLGASQTILENIDIRQIE